MFDMFYLKFEKSVIIGTLKGIGMIITMFLAYPFLLIWVFIGYPIWHFKKCPYTYEFGGKEQIMGAISYVKIGEY